MRGALTAIVAALALLVPAAASGTPGAAHGPILGVVPHAGSPHALADIAAASPTDLSYHGGPVMHSSTTYAIYWFPPSYTLDPTYENTINQYFTDVAAASGSRSNVYSADTQYYDTAGPIAYNSSFGGAYVDTTSPFPNDCIDGQDPVCNTDAAIEAEIQRVLTVQGWQGGPNHLFFVMTPDGVGSCVNGTPPPNGECSTNYFCAYHSDFFDTSGEDVLYANEPFEGTSVGCTGPGQGFPNNVNADTTINTISHEHNEAITDPTGQAWWTDDPNPTFNGMEIGDLCAYTYGPNLGTTAGGQPYNQVINGHDYSLQQEYSNDGSACAQRYPYEAPNNASPPTVSGTAAQGQVLSATSGTWTQVTTSYTYQWLRCSSTSETTCFAFPGDTGQTYRLTAADVGKIFRIAVYAQNGVGTSLPAWSAPTAAVVPVPSATALPVLSGTWAVGKILSATGGTWNTPVTLAYQWLRCASDGTGCSTIPGAAATTYLALAADGGHRLEVRVTGTNAAGTAQVFSDISRVLVAVPHPNKGPRVSGRARVGRRLSANHGSWSGPPKSYRYQWLRCNAHGGSCRSIHHATHATYRVTRADAKHKLRVRVKAANVAGSRTATSRATAKVPAVRKRH